MKTEIVRSTKVGVIIAPVDCSVVVVVVVVVVEVVVVVVVVVYYVARNE